MKKKITVIGNSLAFDEINGFTMAFGLYEALSKKYDINIIVPRESRIYPDRVQPLGQNIAMRSVPIDDSVTGVEDTCEYFNRLAENPTFSKNMNEAVGDAELIICDGFFYVSLARKLFPKKTIIFRSLHVEYDQLLWRNHYTSEMIPQADIDSTFRLEKEACEDADWIFALTDYDADRMCELYGIQKKKIQIVPLCFTDAYLSKNYLPKRRSNRKALYMSACPIENAESFVSMTKCFPEIEFHIVGKAGWELQGYDSNVIVYGFVNADQLQRIKAECDFALNLTHMMSGMNSKMVDYFSSGIPVLCTGCGARGFQAIPGVHYFPVDFDTLEQDIQAFLVLSDEERYQVAVNAFHHLCNVFDYMNYTKYVDTIIADGESAEEKVSYYIFGAGVYGRNAFFELKKMEEVCVGFVDNDSKRWGELYCGVKIVSPEEAFREVRSHEHMHIRVAVSMRYLGEILKQVVSQIGTEQLSVYGSDEIDWDKVIQQS